MNDILPHDILKLFLKKEHVLVCKNWYKAWRKKPILININEFVPKSFYSYIHKFNVNKLHFNNDYPANNILYELPNLKKVTFFNINTITNDEILKYTNITSLKLIKNTSIHNKAFNHLPNLTNLNIDYYDNLNKEFSFDFCTNIKKLSLTISDTYKLPSHKMYNIFIKKDNTGNYVLEKFSNVSNLKIKFCESGYDIIMNGLRKLNNLTNLKVEKYTDSPCTGLVVLQNRNYNSEIGNLPISSYLPGIKQSNIINFNSSYVAYLVNMNDISHINTSKIINLSQTYSLSDQNVFSDYQEKNMIYSVSSLLDKHIYRGPMGD